MRRSSEPTDLQKDEKPIQDAIARGELAVSERRVISHEEAKARLIKWLS